MELDIAKLCDKTTMILFSLLHFFVCTFSSVEVYFDKFGHCERAHPFALADEEYLLKHIGGEFAHETLICDITFKSPPGYGICLTFREFEINDCSVRLKIYAAATSKGPEWRVLDCTDSRPGKICISDRHVTVRVIKDKLNYNRGYTFQIQVEKSNNITEKGVLFASIGVFAAVIATVVLLTISLAFSLLYCCFRKRRNSLTVKNAEAAETAPEDSGTFVQPSAPPVDEDRNWTGSSGCHLYSQSHFGPYPLQHMPPPYMPPPPYQLNSCIEVPSPKSDPDQTNPVK